MGQKALRRKRFLTKHPFCCFCGGETASVEIDHIPSRALFDSRHFPEGFEFPACYLCNHETNLDEQVVAMLASAYPDPITEIGKKEARDRIQAVANNSPKVLAEMQLSATQRSRVALVNSHASNGSGTNNDPHVLNFGGQLVSKAVENFSRKLFCALYYKHAEKSLSREQGVAIRWWSNLQIHNNEIPEELASIVTNFPTLERNNANLESQFFYRWHVSKMKNIAVFLSFFRQSFAILGYVNELHNFDLPPDALVLQPYDRTKVESDSVIVHG